MDNCIVPDALVADGERAFGGSETDPYLLTDLYLVYRSIVAAASPKTLLEIGVRYGYSFAVALDAAPSITRAIAVDISEGGGWGGAAGAFRQAEARLREMQPSRWAGTRLEFYEADTQQASFLPFTGMVDLAYVDGDHSVSGCLHDLGLVLQRLSPQGTIVVDGVDHHPELRQPVLGFAAASGLVAAYFPDGAGRGRLVLTRQAGSGAAEGLG